MHYLIGLMSHYDGCYTLCIGFKLSSIAIHCEARKFSLVFNLAFPKFMNLALIANATGVKAGYKKSVMVKQMGHL
jgi:hypothetical protein